jgi:predicted small secreted protein
MKMIIKMMLVASVVSFAACSTVAGVGKDIQDTANWTKDKMSGK